MSLSVEVPPYPTNLDLKSQEFGEGIKRRGLFCSAVGFGMIAKCLLSCTLAASRVCEDFGCGGERVGLVARQSLG